MGSKGLIKRVLPFFATFAVGIFIASFFVSVGPNWGRHGRWHLKAEMERLQTENDELRNENLRLRNDSSCAEMDDYMPAVPRPLDELPPLPALPPASHRHPRGDR